MRSLGAGYEQGIHQEQTNPPAQLVYHYRTQDASPNGPVSRTAASRKLLSPKIVRNARAAVGSHGVGSIDLCL